MESLQKQYADAQQSFADWQKQDALEDYDNYETTIERLTAGGFVQGFESGALAGYGYAIYLLECEGFHEHAHVLRSQLPVIESLFDGGE